MNTSHNDYEWEELPRSTSWNGLPLAKMAFSPRIEKASPGVHSAKNGMSTELDKTSDK
jgi:hypothetical protein